MENQDNLHYILDFFEEKDDEFIKELEETSAINGEFDRNEILLRFLANDFKSEDTKTVIRNLAVSISHFVFRNSGPIEDLHSGIYSIDDYRNIPEGTPIDMISQLTDADMKAINKNLVDRIGYILNLFLSANYKKLSTIINLYKHSGSDWDSPDTKTIDEEANRILLLLYRLENNDSQE